MPVSTRDTKQEILELAEAMIQRQGFNGFSYQHLSERLGIKNAAIHYHFRSKSDLGRAVIEAYRQRPPRMGRGPDGAGATPEQLLDGYIGMMRSFLEAGEGGKICPGGILTAEFNAIPEDMQEPTRQLLRDVPSGWPACWRAVGSKASSASPARRSDRAMVVAATVLGAVQVGRASGIDHFERVVDTLRRELMA